jgi:hypothetical protein
MPTLSASEAELAADCLACDLAAGRRPLPGGLLHRTEFWLVEHCIGPLGLGTLIVKPERHVTAVAELLPGESAELGPLLQRASWVAGRLVDAEQVYKLPVVSCGRRARAPALRYQAGHPAAGG